MKQCRKVHKLSMVMTSASIRETRKKMDSLRRLLVEADALFHRLSDVVDSLRKVASPGGEPFLFTQNLQDNEHLLKSAFYRCDDVRYRRFQLGTKQALLIFVDGMIDQALIEKGVLDALISLPDNMAAVDIQTVEQSLFSSQISITKSARQVITSIFAGHAALCIDGSGEIILIGAVKYAKRNVSESNTEDVIRGPHDSFNETLADNLTLLRRRARDPHLKIVNITIQSRTMTSVAVVYIDNLVKPGLVEDVEEKLRKIQTGRVIASANIEEFLSYRPWSPFPQIQTTERPDKIIAAIYEGRVGIIVDTTPAALILPVTYATIMQTPDDFTTPALVASLIVFTRHVSAFIAVFLPAFYISIVSYHPGMLPTTLAISIAELRSRTPFPSFLEAVLMESLIEIFQEAITRLPQKIAQAAGVVGALIIGTTIVQAGLVNALLVVVTALTAIASFCMPSYNFALALRFFRVPMLILGSTFGLYGMMAGFIAIVIHLCSLRSYGESFLGGLFDITLLEDMKDKLMRAPLNFLRSRPKEYGAQERTRTGDTIE